MGQLPQSPPGSDLLPATSVDQCLGNWVTHKAARCQSLYEGCQPVRDKEQHFLLFNRKKSHHKNYTLELEYSIIKNTLSSTQHCARFLRCDSRQVNRTYSHRCTGVRIFGDAKSFYQNLSLFFPNNV